MKNYNKHILPILEALDKKRKEKKITMNVPLEHTEQANFFKAARLILGIYYPLIFAIPNGGKRTGRDGKGKQREGLKKGVPDIFLAMPKIGYHGLFIEMKRLKGSTTSDEQKAYIKLLNRTGYKAVICKGYAKAVEVLRDYLKGQDEKS